MKLHDLRPAEGSRTARTRVGRGIAAGKGKTAGRGTKGQKARAGGSIPPWFEGGQTPLHMRIPKLRGFRNRFKVDYEIVNVGDIARVVESGRLPAGEAGGRGTSKAPITVNQDLLKDAGLIRTLDKPMKVLGDGDLSVALFVVADAFTRSARAKIEAAGGSVNVLEIPGRKQPALGVERDPAATSAGVEPLVASDAGAAPADAAPADAEAARPARARRPKASAASEASETAPEASAGAQATEEPDPATAEAASAEAGADEATPDAGDVTSPSDQA
jgi:large subunit ribosomal protein L15